MSEEIERAVTLDNRAVEARQSRDQMERLIEDFRPFLSARVDRYGQSDDKREELMSAAMLGFYEAVRSYDAAKGHFFPFANRVVYERIIDRIRKAYRQGEQAISLDEESDLPGMAQSPVVAEASIRTYDAQVRQQMLAEEISQFKAELAAWGITMETLSRQSPKHQKLCGVCREAVIKIAGSADIIQTIQLKHYFPMKAISEITGLPPKKLERVRTFILASLMIRLGDYDYLSDYVQWDRGGTR